METPIEGGSAGWEVRESLFELQRYLSDQIAPLMVHDSVEVLLRQPPELAVNEIQAWAAEQYSIGGTQTPVSDYYFHAIKKLHLMTEYKLISEQALLPYLEHVSGFLLLACPEEDRALLASNIARLGKTETISSGPVTLLHRQAGSEAPLATAKRATTAIPSPAGAALPPEVSQAAVEGLRRFTILMDRLEPSAKDPRATLKPPSTEKRRELLSEMLSVAARDSKNGTELDGFLARLRGLGMDSRMDQVFRALSTNLPGWAIPTAPARKGAKAPESIGAVEAMHKLVTMTDDSGEAGRRFNEMVRAAVDQFNEGALGRAATMFDLAERIVAEKKVDPVRADQARRSMHEALDTEKLRAYADDESRQSLLRKVLVFFPALAPEGLLTELETENKRERRRLLVTLLQVHGAPARRAALDKLSEPVNPASGAAGWYFQRNLLNVLRRIPRPDDSPIEGEIEVLGHLTRPGHHVLILKDAIANLGQIRHENAGTVLVAAGKEFESLASKPPGGMYGAEDLATLLDRTYASLARIGTRSALAAVVDHGLNSDPALGDTRARLAELAAIDLSGEPALVSRLAAVLRKELPRKVFGLVLARNAPQSERLIEALSGTRSPDVRRLFQEIARDYPDQAFARAAAKALAASDSAPVAIAEAALAPSLSGDLELFGLPSLLQNLAQSEVTGQLSITDRTGGVLATLAFEKGRVSNCRSGVLRGKDAVYQLFENPVPGNFSFSARRDGLPSSPEAGSLLEIVPLIFEGSRRYDEYRQARALVPDGALLVATGKPPTPLEEETDPTLFQGVWTRIRSGATPAECETDFFVDSFRIYRLLAHWIEEGSLEANAAA